jgi:hypothetical protein
LGLVIVGNVFADVIGCVAFTEEAIVKDEVECILLVSGLLILFIGIILYHFNYIYEKKLIKNKNKITIIITEKL